MSGLKIEVGKVTADTIAKMSKRANDAIAAVGRGEEYQAPLVIRFETWGTMFRVMSANRVALLEHMAEHHVVRSTRALSIALGRDYAAVHADVAELVQYGLLERQGTVLRAMADVGDVEMEAA